MGLQEATQNWVEVIGEGLIVGSRGPTADQTVRLTARWHAPVRRPIVDDDVTAAADVQSSQPKRRPYSVAAE